MGAHWLAGYRLVFFAGLAAVAVWLWLRQRTERPRIYLAACFVSILLAMVIGTFAPVDDLRLLPALQRLVAALLLAFPYLLAAFAWSFGGPLPTWLSTTAIPVASLGLWGALLPPQAGEDTGPPPGFLVAYLTVWTVLSLAAVVRLWRGGDGSRTVRSRMRLLAVAAVFMTAALLAAGSGAADDDLVGGLIRYVLPILAAGLFLAGFAPPLPLRLWWRHQAMVDFEDTHLALARATTATDVAASATARLANLLGGSVALVARDGQALAAEGIPPQEAVEIARRADAGEQLDERLEVVLVDTLWLVVRTSSYAPLFGQQEKILLQQFVGQLELTFERTRLFDAHREARAAAEQARAELEATVYGLAHDLKNPTIALMGFAELLPDIDDQGERDEVIAHLQRSATFIHDLVDALLELSRVGKTLTQSQPVDLGPVARRVAARVSAANPRVNIEIDPKLPVIDVNPVRAEQLLENLVSNAVRHGGKEDLTVKLTGERHDGEVSIVVADDGRGIAAEDKERIFELFQRGPSTAAVGSGIGLTMVRRIAESYRGSVNVAEAGPGATFVVRLPGSLVSTEPV